MSGQGAGAIFLDISEAFGPVDRQLLLIKLSKDLNISRRLPLHCNAFLTGGKVRIILNGKEGDWLDLVFGTSVGTILTISTMHQNGFGQNLPTTSLLLKWLII